MTTHSEIMQGVRRCERWHCRLLFTVCFLALWPIALVARLTGWRWQPWSRGAGRPRSAFREALTMAEIAVGTVLST
jgi:hypothetical protein